MVSDVTRKSPRDDIFGNIVASNIRSIQRAIDDARKSRKSAQENNAEDRTSTLAGELLRAGIQCDREVTLENSSELEYIVQSLSKKFTEHGAWFSIIKYRN